MAELKYDPRNYRIHTDKNKRLIKKSLEDCGTGRSILLERKNLLMPEMAFMSRLWNLG